MTDATPEQRIWLVVAQIPYGKVITYGDVAKLAGLANGARLVGRTLSKLPAGSTLPWHRVINSRGMISFPADSVSYRRQAEKLGDEGVPIKSGKIDLKRFRWQAEAAD